MTFGDLANLFEIAIIGKANPDVLHHGLNNETGDITWGECAFKSIRIVERDNLHIFHNTVRNPARLRHRVWRMCGSRLIERRLVRNHHFVVVAVIPAFDLDNFVSTRNTTSKSNCIHRGFSS